MTESNVVQIPVRPKQVSERYSGQKIHLVFCPGALTDSEKWQWRVTVTREYVFTGSASTETRARTMARKRIDELVGSPESKRNA